jgi:ribosomal protein L40E
MKKCADCGVEYPDEATQCVTCHTDLLAPSASNQAAPKTESMMSPEGQRFWERMTFRQFTILFLRLQAVWLLFYAAIDVTYLPPYFIRLNEASSYSARSPQLSLGFFLALLRII